MRKILFAVIIAGITLIVVSYLNDDQKEVLDGAVEKMKEGVVEPALDKAKDTLEGGKLFN